MEESTLKEKVLKKYNQWKSEVEHLKVQLQLGATEAKSEFEKQKKSLDEWIITTKEQLSKLKNISKEKSTELRTKLEKLRALTTLGKAETEDALKEQYHKIHEGIHNIKESISKTSEDTREDIKEFAETLEEKLDNYHTRFDLLRLQLYLGKKEGKEQCENKKKELATKLHNFNTKLEAVKEVSAEKWTNFSSEMKEMWTHLKMSVKR
ncbi:MAG: hypothetical protein JXA16_13405 [Bacteroidales bacterium]|nr:hypothetical protein [Bacteroidales bacterium]